MAKLPEQGSYPEFEFDEKKYIDSAGLFYMAQFMKDCGFYYLTLKDLEAIIEIMKK